MRPRIAFALACLALVAAAGCGKQDDSTPAACLQGQDIYLAALAKAPGAVELAGETTISECLAENQTGGDLATVGEAMVETATVLNGEARGVPGSPAALQLGYLLGAAQRGADRTEGIHADLIRRLTVAARYSPKGPLPPAFLAAYREGFDAGRAGG
ncbi:MAG TPA: hypothetical protein VGO36_08665 [Solirubrobacterales bacterium]|jgi:hypothetical protein|nr:hypothetical protein [Solirubrobacterales bacterium]